jgi:hypothetical protein
MNLPWISAKCNLAVAHIWSADNPTMQDTFNPPHFVLDHVQLAMPVGQEDAAWVR